MPKFIPNIILSLIFWGIFIFIVFNIPYPESLVQANFSQIIPFIISLLLALISTFNILLKNIFQSFSITLMVIFFLILNALDALNIVTALLTLAASGLLFSYFRKGNSHFRKAKNNPLTNSGFKNLTKQSKIPKLTQLRK